MSCPYKNSLSFSKRSMTAINAIVAVDRNGPRRGPQSAATHSQLDTIDDTTEYTPKYPFLENYNGMSYG